MDEIPDNHLDDLRADNLAEESRPVEIDELHPLVEELTDWCVSHGLAHSLLVHVDDAGEPVTIVAYIAKDMEHLTKLVDKE